MKITSKDLHVMVKRGTTTAELVERYGLENEKELYELIKQITPGEYRVFKTTLSRNDKKARTKKEGEKAVPETRQYEIPIEVTKVSLCEELKAEEKALSDEIIRLENLHKGKCAERREIVGKLKEIRRKLCQLYSEIDTNRKEIIRLSENFNQRASEMSELSKRISDKKKDLADIRQRLDECQKVILFVYSDGSLDIECIDQEVELDVPDINVTQFICRYEKVLQNFRLHQIATLAKVFELTKRFYGENIKFELIFEESGLREAFDEISKGK